MNISKPEQRTLHALAQGGVIVLERDDRGDVVAADCLNSAGWQLSDCDVGLWRKLKRRGLIASRGGGPYRITRQGLTSLRAQLDNRTSVRGW